MGLKKLLKCAGLFSGAILVIAGVISATVAILAVALLGGPTIIVNVAKGLGSVIFLTTLTASAAFGSLLAYLYHSGEDNRKTYHKLMKQTKLEIILSKIADIIPSIKNRKMLERIDQEIASENPIKEEKNLKKEAPQQSQEAVINELYAKAWKKIENFLGPKLYEDFVRKINKGEISRSFNDPKRDLNNLLTAAAELKQFCVAAYCKTGQEEPTAHNIESYSADELNPSSEADILYTPPQSETPTILQTTDTTERTTAMAQDELIASAATRITAEPPLRLSQEKTHNIVEETLEQIPAPAFQEEILSEDIPDGCQITASMLQEMTIPMETLEAAKNSFKFETEQVHPELHKLIEGRRALEEKLYSMYPRKKARAMLNNFDNQQEISHQQIRITEPSLVTAN